MNVEQRQSSGILICVYSEGMATRRIMPKTGMLARGVCLGTGILIR